MFRPVDFNSDRAIGGGQAMEANPGESDLGPCSGCKGELAVFEHRSRRVANQPEDDEQWSNTAQQRARNAEQRRTHGTTTLESPRWYVRSRIGAGTRETKASSLRHHFVIGTHRYTLITV